MSKRKTVMTSLTEKEYEEYLEVCRSFGSTIYKATREILLKQIKVHDPDTLIVITKTDVKKMMLEEQIRIVINELKKLKDMV